MDITQRLEKIKTVEDLEKQIVLAKKYYMGLRTKSKNTALTLAEKVELGRSSKLAEQTFRRLRVVAFDVEDALLAGKPASSVI